MFVMCICPQKPNILSLIVFLNPATIEVASIMTIILKAIAMTESRKIDLEKDFFDVMPTRFAMRNSRFNTK